MAGEIGVGDSDTAILRNRGGSSRIQTCNGEGHGDAMILVAVDDSTMKRVTAFNDHAILGLADMCSHGGQVADNGLYPVGFLDL